MRIGLKLREAVQNHGTDTAYKILKDGMESGAIPRHRLSLLEMAGSFLGENWEEKLRKFNDVERSGERQVALYLQETADALDASAFVTIGGQLAIDIVQDKYKQVTSMVNQHFTTISAGKNPDTVTVPWVSDVLDEPARVHQLQPYPLTTIKLQTTTLPAVEKWGRIALASMESIRFDKTGQVIESLESVGKRTAVWEIKQKLRVMLGITNNHIFNGTTYNTYLTSGIYVNAVDNFTLTDWTSLESIDLLFQDLADPVTGEPIEIDRNSIFVMPFKRWTLKRIMNATEIRTGDITTGAGTQTVSSNPIEGDFEMWTDRRAKNLLTTEGGVTAAVANTYMIVGDFKRAFGWREVEPMRTFRMPAGSEMEFTRDIAFGVKARLWGVAYVRDPRYVVRVRNTSA